MRIALAAAAVLLAVAPATAQTLIVAAPPAPERVITANAIADLPSATLPVVHWTNEGPERGAWSGVLLWDVVAPLDLPPEGRLARTVLVSGRDGDTVALAWGEIDPEFGGALALLATTRDGAPFEDGGMRLVVPGDKRGGRAVRDVVRVEVR